MNTDKFITEFQNINSKLNIYEQERNNLLLKIKTWEKENKKLNEKLEKESDPILKSLISTKVVCNKYFIQELNSILLNSNKDIKNDKTV